MTWSLRGCLELGADARSSRICILRGCSRALSRVRVSCLGGSAFARSAWEALARSVNGSRSIKKQGVRTQGTKLAGSSWRLVCHCDVLQTSASEKLLGLPARSSSSADNAWQRGGSRTGGCVKQRPKRSRSGSQSSGKAWSQGPVQTTLRKRGRSSALPSWGSCAEMSGWPTPTPRIRHVTCEKHSGACIARPPPCHWNTSSLWLDGLLARRCSQGTGVTAGLCGTSSSSSCLSPIVVRRRRML